MEARETTLLKHRDEMLRKPLPECHGGKGVQDSVNVLASEDVPARSLKFIHDDVLEPGVTIGLHKHGEDEEYYFIVSGSGVMTLDKRRFEVAAGDVTAVFPGGEHALENTGNIPMRVIVICVAGAKSNRVKGRF